MSIRALRSALVCAAVAWLAIASAAGVFLLFPGCGQGGRHAGPVEYGPRTSQPAQIAPTLDYEEFAGLDPLTQQTIQERERNNDLEFRVDHLERQVRRLNQIILGIPEIRIGEPPPATTEPNFELAPPAIETPPAKETRL